MMTKDRVWAFRAYPPSIFDFELSASELAQIGALDKSVRGGPKPDSITHDTYGVAIPEA
jgi:hypothetical protein